MVELIAGNMRANVVALAAHGKVTHSDYERVVIPTVKEKIRLHDKIRFFFHLGEDFAGYSAEAIWDDAKIGLQHVMAFEKIAVVTNVVWVKEAVRIFGVFVPCPVKVFANEDISNAAAWVNK
ncbi:MAG: STAS/SEC14 domain-containing protein [Methylacidiphilales bacterium]|nr:STAS/SEC14 domain-containing protein [Candidatus Methylacidiphilales bacterium]